MKSAWHIHWDNEVQYFGPERSRMVAFCEAANAAAATFRPVIAAFGMSMKQATESLNKFAESFRKIEEHQKSSLDRHIDELSKRGRWEP